MDINPDELENLSPEGVARKIFTNEAKDPCSYMILAYQEGDDLTMIYEILLIILLEGIEIFTGGLDTADLSRLTKDHLTHFDSWFNSLGFKIFIEECDIEEKDKYLNHYCKVILNNKENNYYEHVFKSNKITKNYHFLLNGDTIEENRNKKKLKNIHSIILTKSKAFIVKFDFYSKI